MNDEERIINNTNTFLKEKLQGINLQEIKTVPMDNYGITDNEKKVLVTYGLATCTALIAITNNFAFLAHIDNGFFSRNSFGDSILSNQNRKEHSTLKTCKMTENLLIEILKRRNEITRPLYLQLVTGCMPLPNDDIHITLTEDGIERLINICRDKLGIQVIRKPNISSTVVLVNSTTQEILVDESETQISKDEAR